MDDSPRAKLRALIERGAEGDNAAYNDHLSFLLRECARATAREICNQAFTGGGDATLERVEHDARALAARMHGGNMQSVIDRSTKEEPAIVAGCLWRPNHEDNDATLRDWITAFAALYARRYGAVPYFW